MEASYDKNAAVIVLPPVSQLDDTSLQKWLARSELGVEPQPNELLATILGAIGQQCPPEGLGALRMWGQTGDRPTVWIAAADPVYLEPQLDQLRLHALSRTSLEPAELRALVDHLQQTLATDAGFGFARLGSSCYVRAKEALATAALPAKSIDQQVPSDFLPQGPQAAAFRNLQGEIEMALHEHEVNQRRAEAGKQPVNSLWIWGGGMAPERTTRFLPPLFANDPLLHGYWEASNAVYDLWPGSMEDCLEASTGGFVAVTPQRRPSAAFLVESLNSLRSALRSKRISRLTLLFRDGRWAHVRRLHALRFWRRRSKLLD